MSSIWSLMRAFAWGTSYSARYKMFCGGFEAADKSHRRRRLVAAGNKKVGIADGNAARTCKKLPVASFCASETAETGRIANGREQGDHVGGDRAAKDLIGFVRNRHCGELNRGLQNLEAPCEGDGFILFACTKRTKSTPEVCEPLDSGDDSKLCRRGL